MIDLTKLLPRTAEEYLAMNVLKRINKSKHYENSIFRTMLKYEKLVNAKDHKYHPALRLHVEEQYKKFISDTRFFLDKHKYLIEKYKLK